MASLASAFGEMLRRFPVILLLSAWEARAGLILSAVIQCKAY